MEFEDICANISFHFEPSSEIQQVQKDRGPTSKAQIKSSPNQTNSLLKSDQSIALPKDQAVLYNLKNNQLSEVMKSQKSSSKNKRPRIVHSEAKSNSKINGLSKEKQRSKQVKTKPKNSASSSLPAKIKLDKPKTTSKKTVVKKNPSTNSKQKSKITRKPSRSKSNTPAKLAAANIPAKGTKSQSQILPKRDINGHRTMYMSDTSFENVCAHSAKSVQPRVADFYVQYHVMNGSALRYASQDKIKLEYMRLRKEKQQQISKAKAASANQQKVKATSTKRKVQRASAKLVKKAVPDKPGSYGDLRPVDSLGIQSHPELRLFQ